MKVKCIIGTALRFILEPEDALERAVLQEAATRSEKGTTTILALPAAGTNEFVLEVGGK